MKRGYLYTIVFMLIVSVVFTTLLAGADALYLPKIEENNLLAERTALLYVFDLDQSGSPEEIMDRFDQTIKAADFRTEEAYVHVGADQKPLAYALPFYGPGLWGSISGYLAVTPDFNEIVGLVFTEHSETPGLGGRIDEPAFKEQFRGLPLDPGQQLHYGSGSDSQIDAITGATSTSDAVLQIVNHLIDRLTMMEEEAIFNG